MNFCSSAGMIILKYFFKGNARILVVNFWCCDVNHKNINEFIHLSGLGVSSMLFSCRAIGANPQACLTETLKNSFTPHILNKANHCPGVVYGLSWVLNR